MSPAARPRIVVTGLGSVTSLGPDLPETWRRLVAGENGFRVVTRFDPRAYRCQRAAECAAPAWPDARAADSPKRLARRPLASRLLLPAAAEALRTAGVTPADGLPLSFSTTAGGMAFGEEFLRGLLRSQRAQFTRIARYHPQQQLLDLQDELGFRAGPTFVIANSCASGANAIGHAMDLLQSGRHEIALAGGFEALSELVFAGFDCLQAQTTEECRPFDEGRSGLLLGEAAACLVLETEAHAARRGAEPLAMLAGYGHSTDNHHLTQPAPTGTALAAALRAAFTRAGIASADVDYVNAHGTATPANDPAEQRGYEAAFEGPLPPIRSTKAALGHTLGAAGTLEAVLAVQTLRTGQLPPQINLRAPLPGLAASLTRPLARPPRCVASANLGFGGANAALVFTAP